MSDYQSKRVTVSTDLKTNLRTAVAEGTPESLHNLLADEGQLVPFVARIQRSLRLAGLIPTWEVFAQTEPFWDLQRKMDGTERRKFRAWYRLIYTAQRVGKCSASEDDTKALIFALLAVAARKLQQDGGKIRLMDGADFGIEPEHGNEILGCVMQNYVDLMPCQIGGSAAAAAEIVRPKK